MNLSQLKEQVRNILRERSVKAIQKDYSNVVDDIQKHLELYKKSKGTPEEKKHIGHLKTLGEKKKSLQKELDLAVSDLYKNAELKVDEAITNPKKSNPNDLATTVIGWYDFATDYIDDGGQRRRAIKSNEDVVKWFDSHPLDVKQKAFKVMLSKQPSIKSKIERVFGSSLKESVNEAKTYKKGDKLKIKLPNGKKFDVVFDMYSRTKGVALGKFKDGSGEYNTKPFNLDTIVESVLNEDTRRVKLLGIDFKISEMNGRIFFSFVDKKAASVSLRQVGTNKIVNHIQNRLDIAYGKGTFFFKSGDHAEFQNGYLFQRNTPDINLNKLKFESVNESVNFNGYVSSTDGKTFTLYNSDKKKIKDVSFDDLKNKYMKTYLGQNLKDFKDSFDKTTSKGKYWQYWKGKLVNVKLSNIDESINEATELEIISQLKDIVKNKQYKMIKDPKTGKSLGVDMQTANAVLQIYDGLSNVNKDNMVKMGLPKMIDVSFKIINKYKK